MRTIVVRSLRVVGGRGLELTGLEGGYTLGSVAGEVVGMAVGMLVGASTLGSVAVSGIEGGKMTAVGVCKMGWGTALLSSFAIFMTASFVSSPHCNVGIAGGF